MAKKPKASVKVSDRNIALWTAFKKTSSNVLTIHEQNVVSYLLEIYTKRQEPTNHKEWELAVKAIDKIIKV